MFFKSNPTPLPYPLNYFTVAEILENYHPNFSSYWSSMGFNDDKADGTVTCSKRLMDDMKSID